MSTIASPPTSDQAYEDAITVLLQIAQDTDQDTGFRIQAAGTIITRPRFPHLDENA